MMLTEIDPPAFTPPQKNDVDRLRKRIDSFVATLGDDFPMQTLGCALMAKAAELIVEEAGMLPAVWAAQETRTHNLWAPHRRDAGPVYPQS